MKCRAPTSRNKQDVLECGLNPVRYRFRVKHPGGDHRFMLSVAEDGSETWHKRDPSDVRWFPCDPPPEASRMRLLTIKKKKLSHHDDGEMPYRWVARLGLFPDCIEDRIRRLETVKISPFQVSEVQFISELQAHRQEGRRLIVAVNNWCRNHSHIERLARELKEARLEEGGVGHQLQKSVVRVPKPE